MSYVPQRGSIAWKVIEFLTTNPDEELSRDDVAAKFDAGPNSVHTLLRPSVDAGLLKRVEVEDELVYRLGKGTPLIKPNTAANPTLRTQGGPWPTNGAHRQARKQAPQIDLAAVKLDAGIDLPKGRLTPQHDWSALFKRMKPGQSCVLPVEFRAVCGKACTEFKKAKLGEMSIRVLDNSVMRLWRVK